MSHIKGLHQQTAYAQRPLKAVTIGSISTLGLLDSRATSTVISPGMANKLKGRGHRKLNITRITFLLTCGKIVGKGHVYTTIAWNDGREDRVKLTVLTLPGGGDDLVLGRDFMFSSGIVVDIKNNGWRQGEGKIRPFAVSPDVKQLTQGNTSIPPHMTQVSELKQSEADWQVVLEHIQKAHCSAERKQLLRDCLQKFP